MEKQSFNDKLLTRKQAAEILGVSPRTIESWIYQKKFDLPIVKIGRHTQHWLSDLLKFAEKYTTKRVKTLGGATKCNNTMGTV